MSRTLAIHAATTTEAAPIEISRESSWEKHWDNDNWLLGDYAWICMDEKYRNKKIATHVEQVPVRIERWREGEERGKFSLWRWSFIIFQPFIPRAPLPFFYPARTLSLWPPSLRSLIYNKTRKKGECFYRCDLIIGSCGWLAKLGELILSIPRRQTCLFRNFLCWQWEHN